MMNRVAVSCADSDFFVLYVKVSDKKNAGQQRATGL